MVRKHWFVVLLVCVVGISGRSVRLSAGPPDDTTPKRVPISVARDRAELLHDTFADALEVIHHHYFRREASVLPARALDDVFTRMEKRSGVKMRWISVNTAAMNIDHDPKSTFEKKASKELAAGKSEYTSVENGFYLRAAPIPLGAGCVRCHTRFDQVAVKQPLLAGLVVAIPVQEER